MKRIAGIAVAMACPAGSYRELAPAPSVHRETFASVRPGRHTRPPALRPESTVPSWTSPVRRKMAENSPSAITSTITTNAPRKNPNAPPSNRSNHRIPTLLVAHRAIRPAIPARMTTVTKINRNPAPPATTSLLTYGARYLAATGYSQAARRYPKTVPANENNSNTKPWAAA